jgi:hypothetical protein
MATEKQMVSVKTGEPYQPVRIYYQLFKPKTVVSAFKKLKCMEYETQTDRWNWLYEGEAKKLHFDRSYSTLGPGDKPLILGYFTFRGEDEMLFDLRSTQRAIAGLDFFDKRINRYAANPTRMRLVNRLFSVEEMPNRAIHPSLDPFFDRDNVPCLAKEMEQVFTQIDQDYGDDADGKEQAIKAYLDQQMDRPHPEIEELHIHPDKVERLSLPMALQVRQIEAFEHWRGNFTFRATDALKRWAEALAEELGEEFEDDLFEAAEEAPQEEAPQEEAPPEEALQEETLQEETAPEEVPQEKTAPEETI